MLIGRKYLKLYSIFHILHFPIIISRMLKGVLPQLTSVNAYIQSILPSELQDLTWEIYLLNTEKNTFQILKLMSIILNELEEQLPKGLKLQFQRSCKFLKQYFKCKPKLQIDHEDHHKQLPTPEYDQVQHYLDNKPEITINNEQRSELFKFLSINDQKQKDNAIILESIPRYNFDYAYHPRQSNKKKSTITKNKTNMSELSQVIIKKCDSQTIENVSSEVNILKFTEDAQVQTDPVHAFNTLHNHVVTSTTGLKDLNESFDPLRPQQNGNESKKGKDFEVKKKKKKKSVKENENKNGPQSKSNQTIYQNEANSQLKRKERASAMLSDSKTIKDLSNFETSKQAKHNKKRQSKRESINSIASNKKQMKSIFGKHSQKRLSKDFKDIKEKMSKSKKNISSNYPSTILQTKQELINSNGLGDQNVALQNKQILEDAVKLNVNTSRVVINIPINKVMQEVSKQQQPNNIQQKTEEIQRAKVISNKEDIKQCQLFADKPYAQTIGHPFYRKTSKNDKSDEKGDNRSLPKIQQKNAKARYDSIDTRKKKKTYQNSPYAKPNLEVLANPKIYKNPSLNHRSFHLNPIENRYTFSPTNIHTSQKSHQDLEGSYKNCNSFPKFQINLGQCTKQSEREVLFRQEHNKIVKYIEQSIVNKQASDFQWSKIMKSIKSYERYHHNLCGENCIHLNKFYEFLKKKNLSNYVNRKELIMHKKNIQINYH